MGPGASNRCQVSGARCQEIEGAIASDVKALPDSAGNVEAFEAFGADEVSAFSGASGFSAPAAYAAPRAFTALGGQVSGSRCQGINGDTASEVSETVKKEKKSSKEIKNEEKKENQGSEKIPEAKKTEKEISEELSEEYDEEEIPEAEINEKKG